MKRWAIVLLVISTLLTSASAMLRASPKTPNVLRWYSNQPVVLIDPAAAIDLTGIIFLKALYDSPYRYLEKNGETVLEPWLVKSSRVSPNGKVWTFTLREGVKFHNGDPLTADAVIFSMKRMLRLKKGNSWLWLPVLDESGVTKVDDRTFRLTLKAPYSPLQATLVFLFVLNPAQVQANAGNDDGQTWLIEHSAGSGPYRIARWVHNEVYELERFPQYWAGWDGPHVDRVVWKVTREPATRELALASGEADIVDFMNADAFNRLKQRPGIVGVAKPGPRLLTMSLNTQKAPLDNKDLRKAIAYAIDYNALVNNIYGGYAYLRESPLANGMRWSVPNLNPYRRDVAKAKEHLAKAGYAPGTVKLAFQYVDGLEEIRRLGLLLLDNLREVGIELEVVPVAFAVWLGRMNDPRTSPELVAIYQNPTFNHPHALLESRYHSRNPAGPFRASHYINPTVDRLVDEAILTTNERYAQNLYRQIQEIILEDVPDIFLLQQAELRLHSKRVTRWDFTTYSQTSWFYTIFLENK